MSEVLGAQSKWREAYFLYDECHFVQSNNEIRDFWNFSLGVLFD